MHSKLFPIETHTQLGDNERCPPKHTFKHRLMLLPYTTCMGINRLTESTKFITDECSYQLQELEFKYGLVCLTVKTQEHRVNIMYFNSQVP